MTRTHHVADAENPRFSIVLPVYNGEAYLKECMDSILGQTFGSFELIVWDNGSADGTAEIIASYEDDRIRAFRYEQNQGLFPTLNAACRLAQAPLVRFFCHDDVMRPHCLETENTFWGSHPDLGMVYCQRSIIDETGRKIRDMKTDRTPALLDPSLVAQYSLYYGCMPGNLSTVSLRREALSDIGLFNENMIRSGDFDLWTRIAERFRTGFINQDLLFLRDHRNQLSNKLKSMALRMHEDQEVINRLWPMVPEQVRDHARRYVRWHRYREYTHFAMYALAKGEWGIARRSFRFLREVENLPKLLAIWLLTINGRFGLPRPKFHYPQGSEAREGQTAHEIARGEVA